MARCETSIDVRGPWSLTTSRAFWEDFAPAALTQRDEPEPQLHSVFRVERDWSRAETVVTQHREETRIRVDGDGDLDAALEQVRRFLSLDVDARAWPAVGGRDPVIADAQQQLPGLRPCGFHSPYEAAAWAVLSQRVRIVQAAQLRSDLVARHGEDGAMPAPHVLRDLDLDLPGRKAEYLRAVAEAALEGRLDGVTLRAVGPDEAITSVRQVNGLGPFAAELVVIRGSNAPDVLPHHERRLDAEIAELYGPEHNLDDVAEAWKPFRTWAAVHLRCLRERRTHEIAHPRRSPTS